MAFGSPDQFLMYLIKSAVPACYYSQSSSWERTTAHVTGHAVLDPFLGCPFLKLFYKFESNGHPIKGSDLIPFIGLYHAKYYGDSFPHNLPRTIRVDPMNP